MIVLAVYGALSTWQIQVGSPKFYDRSSYSSINARPSLVQPVTLGTDIRNYKIDTCISFAYYTDIEYAWDIGV